MAPIRGRARTRLFIERDSLLQISGPPVGLGQLKVELRARGRATRDGRFEFTESSIEIRVVFHLREREIEFILRIPLNPGRIEERYSAAIRRRIAVVLFDQRPGRIDCWARLYEVIRNRSVNCI